MSRDREWHWGIAFAFGSAAPALYLPLVGGGRVSSRSEDTRVGVAASHQAPCLLLAPHPGCARESTRCKVCAAAQRRVGWSHKNESCREAVTPTRVPSLRAGHRPPPSRGR